MMMMMMMNIITCGMVERPCELIRRDGILKALRMVKKLVLQELYWKCLWLSKIVMWNG